MSTPNSLRRFSMFHFTLYNKDMDEQGRDAFVKTGQVQEGCWPGTQTRKVLASAGG